jgi:hypothetical protein
MMMGGSGPFMLKSIGLTDLGNHRIDHVLQFVMSSWVLLAMTKAIGWGRLWSPCR